MVAPANQHLGWKERFEQELLAQEKDTVFELEDKSQLFEATLALPRVSRREADEFEESYIFNVANGLVEVVTSGEAAYLVSDPTDLWMAPLPPIP